MKEIPKVKWTKKTMRPTGIFSRLPAWKRHRSFTLPNVVLEIQEDKDIYGRVVFLKEEKIYHGRYKSIDLAKRGLVLKALRGVKK